jgi:hypothetical protein
MYIAHALRDRVISGINLGAGAEFTDGYSLFLEQVSDLVKRPRLVSYSFRFSSLQF